MTLNVGFDPSFIDYIVYVKDEKGQLVKTLPKIGFHNRNSTIEKFAGGNGLNIGRTLTKLGANPKIVIPISPELLQLIILEGIISRDQMIEIETSRVNSTVAITIENGEIQFNDARSILDKIYWNSKIDKLWKESKYFVFTNWGLNPTAKEWISTQILSSAGWSFNEISDLNDPYVIVVNSDLEIQKPIFIEPGLFKLHSECKELGTLLKMLSNYKTSIILGNEEESPFFQSILKKKGSILTHSSTSIQFFSENTKFTVYVPKLPSQIKNFLGAGDAFLAGLLFNFKEEELSEEIIMKAIKVAQDHIMRTK